MTAAAVVAALMLLPGAGAALAVAAPGAVSIETRIALAFGLGYALVAGVATLLALAHLFSPPAFVAGVVLATVVVWALALRRAAPHAHALRAQARETPFTLAAGLALLLAIAASRPFYPASANLSIAGPWRYWADGLEVAAAGHVPAKTEQWGIEMPTTVSKAVLNAFEGGVSFLLGADPLPPMHGILSVTALGLVAALLALGRELGLGSFAPLVPVLAVLVPAGLPLSHELSGDLSTYKVENLGRMVALCALLVGIQVVRGRVARSVWVVTGVLFAVAALTHLVPALIAGAMLALYALAVVLSESVALRSLLPAGVVITAVCGLSYLGVLGLAGGEVGFERATTAPAFEGLPAGVDPTRSFATARFVRQAPARGNFKIAPRTLATQYVSETVGFRLTPRLGALVLLALALGSVVMLLLARPLIPLVVVSWGLVATVAAVALLFSYRYRTWIPANFGPRRLYDYAALPPALLVPGVLAAITRSLTQRSRLAVAALSLACGAIAVAAAIDRIPRDGTPAGATAGLAAIERVARVLPCGPRMLANARTAGTWEAMTGRRSLTEGMAPYLRPEVMRDVLPILIGARRFFSDPQSNSAFIVRHRVEFLVVVRPGDRIGMARSDMLLGDDPDAVTSVPGVHLVYRDPRVAIFAVGSHRSREADGQPRRCPL